MDSPPSPAAADAVRKVLGDDVLLREIILRLACPTALVRAALVCKRWFRHASDPALLRRLRQLHPPRLLGVYVQDGFPPDIPTVLPCFVPMVTQAEEPELAAILRRMKSLDLDIDDKVWIKECRNGSVFISGYRGLKYTYEVHSPLFPERGTAVLPPPPPRKVTDEGNISSFGCFLSKGGDGCLSYMWLAMEINMVDGRSTGKIIGKVYMLQDGVWVMHTKATAQLTHPLFQPEPLLVNDKIYMPGGTSYNMYMAGGHSSDILVLDLGSSSFFTIQAPEGVEWFCRFKEGIECDNRDTVFSRADDSGLYVMDVKELQLRIWLHKDGNWLLMDTICLREVCAALGMSDGMVEGEHTDAVRISQVGDNAEFVFLEMGRCTVYLDIRRRAQRKVYDMTEKDRRIGQIHPFMMIWPPTFPVLQDDHTSSWKFTRTSDFVKISASWSEVLMKLVLMLPSSKQFLMKWYRRSLCLLRSWKKKTPSEEHREG